MQQPGCKHRAKHVVNTAVKREASSCCCCFCKSKRLNHKIYFVNIKSWLVDLTEIKIRRRLTATPLQCSSHQEFRRWTLEYPPLCTAAVISLIIDRIDPPGIDPVPATLSQRDFKYIGGRGNAARKSNRISKCTKLWACQRKKWLLMKFTSETVAQQSAGQEAENRKQEAR